MKKITNIPTHEIDSCSESIGGEVFEPREDHNGNLARAVYYFYTMYTDKIGDFSEIAKKDVLFQWHLKDPVDDIEKEIIVLKKERGTGIHILIILNL